MLLIILLNEELNYPKIAVFVGPFMFLSLPKSVKNHVLAWLPQKLPDDMVQPLVHFW